MFNDLVFKYEEKGWPIRKCVFIWSVKDLAMVGAMDQNRVHTQDLHTIVPYSDKDIPSLLPTSFQPDLLSASLSDLSDLAAGQREESGSAKSNKDQPKNANFVIIDQPGYTLANDDFASSSLPVFRPKSISFKDADFMSADPFHAEFYLTSLRNEQDYEKANIAPADQPYLRMGRPDLDAIFKRVTTLCGKSSIPRVAVVVCGPDEVCVCVCVCVCPHLTPFSYLYLSLSLSLLFVYYFICFLLPSFFYLLFSTPTPLTPHYFY